MFKNLRAVQHIRLRGKSMQNIVEFKRYAMSSTVCDRPPGFSLMLQNLKWCLISPMCTKYLGYLQYNISTTRKYIQGLFCTHATFMRFLAHYLSWEHDIKRARGQLRPLNHQSIKLIKLVKAAAFYILSQVYRDGGSLRKQQLFSPYHPLKSLKEPNLVSVAL